MKNNIQLLEKLIKKFNKFETTYGKFDLSNYILENRIEVESKLVYFKKKIELGMDLENEINKIVSRSFTTQQAKRKTIQEFYMDMFVYRIILLEEFNINYYEIYSSLLHNILTYIFKHKNDDKINIKDIIALSINTQEVLKNLLPEEVYNKIKFD
jgi:hypothetical protein